MFMYSYVADTALLLYVQSSAQQDHVFCRFVFEL